MSSATIKAWVDTGTGRQAPIDLSVEVAGGTIAGAASGAKRFVASAALVADDLVYIDGWNVANELPTMAKADADAAGKHAQFVIRDTIGSGAIGVAYTTHESSATLNTDAATAAGDPVYLSTTAGGWTVTAPTGASAVQQIVGRVQVKSATVGVVQFDLGDQPTVGTNDLQDLAVTAGKIANATITTTQISATAAITGAQLAAGADIARSQLAENALAVYGIPFSSLKSDAGASLTAAETAGTFNVSVAANVALVQGEITDNETEVSTGVFQFVLPPEYVSAGDVQVRIKTKLVKTGAAVDNGSTIDVEAYEQDGNGAVGADICATAAQSWAAVDTWYTKTFTITATGLVAGDILNVKIVTSVIDSEAGGGTLRANLDGIAVLLDVKG